MGKIIRKKVKVSAIEMMRILYSITLIIVYNNLIMVRQMVLLVPCERTCQVGKDRHNNILVRIFELFL